MARIPINVIHEQEENTLARLKRVKVDYTGMGRELYKQLVKMGQYRHLEQGTVAEWAKQAIEDATREFVIMHLALQEIGANPNTPCGILILRPDDMEQEIARHTGQVIKAILREAASVAQREN